jgi:hypothetical protein
LRSREEIEKSFKIGFEEDPVAQIGQTRDNPLVNNLLFRTLLFEVLLDIRNQLEKISERKGAFSELEKVL